MKKPLVTILLVIFGIAPLAEANGKVDVMLGSYTLSAKTRTASKSISGLGSYQLGYRYSFLNHLDVQLAYSLIASKTFSGDLGYGPDFGVVYFPFTSSGPIAGETPTLQVKIHEYYKPFVSFAFHQRQYQSTQSAYAGFSGSGGSEFFYNSQYSFKAELRIIQLAGPSNTTATETDLLLGIVYQL